MLKAIVVLIMLSAIACTTYGAPVEANDGNFAAEAIENSGLVSSRNRRGLSTSQCIKYLYVMAYTSGIPYAGADQDHRIRLQAKGLSNTIYLPDLPQDDYLPNKGDLWKLDLKASFGFTSCITINDIKRISILQGSNDGWNIESIVTFAVVDQNNWELTSADFNVFQWIDGDGAKSSKEFTLSLRASTSQCIHYLYVMAHTSDARYGGADSSHRIELRITGATKSTALPDLPGDDYFTSKGDLWKLSIKDHFGLSGCITKTNIKGIAVLAGSNDGWHIDSIVTYVAVNRNNWELSSVNFGANRWVDGDSSNYKKRFELNLVL